MTEKRICAVCLRPYEDCASGRSRHKGFGHDAVEIDLHAASRIPIDQVPRLLTLLLAMRKAQALYCRKRAETTRQTAEPYLVKAKQLEQAVDDALAGAWLREGLF